MQNRLFNIWYLASFYRWFLYCLLTGSAALFAVKLAAQDIPCDGSYYLFLTPHSNSKTSSMYRVTKHATTQLPVFQLIKADLGYRVTAAGYSVWAQRIYALDYNTRQLLRIDASGAVEAFRVPLSLDTTNIFLAGEVSPGGGNLLVVGRDEKTRRDKTLFSIRLFRDDFLAGRVSILSDFGAALEDMAFDPVRGTFYGYDGLNNKLAWVNNFSGQVIDYFSRNMEGVGLLGSLFFDRSGQLHAYGSSGGNEEKTFYDIDKLQGKAESVASGPPGRFSDGCSCPYTIRNYKTVQPQQALPCNELTVTYDIINHAGTAYSYIQIKDTFPVGFVIKNIVKAPHTAFIASGIGSNILSIKEMDMILDTNRIIITLEISEDIQPGTYASQAFIGELPPAFGGIIGSDDPTTNALTDATTIQIIGEENKEMLIQQQILCNNEGILLTTELTGATYEWSTGDTTAATLAASTGWYAVTITSGCGTLVDSIYIENIPAPLNVMLPPTATIELGETLNITPTTNASGMLIYQWLASDGSGIDCTSCATLAARPSQNTTYTLLLTDENGCQSIDSVQVTVVPVREIFAPTAFSPNNDGINDIFYLQGKSDSKIIYLRIFDRWGNQVFQVQNGILNDPTFGWNGKVNNKIITSQTLVFAAEIEFPDGVRKRLQGEVSLLK